MCTIVFFLLVIFASGLQAGESHFSTAGFYELAGSGREVYNMNVGWRFHKGSCPDAWQRDFDDSLWDIVSIPHGIELLPEEASGNINYQGEAWYRKTFSVPENLKNKIVYLHFEGIMGKSRIWLNGKLLREHYNGYLPVIVDVTEGLNFETANTLAICADNSDDPSFLPGKPQQALDFTYFGGIYRDCFLIAHNPVHITDANYEDEIAGGGVFIHYPFVSEDKAEIGVKIHLRNESSGLFKGELMLTLRDISGKEISRGVKKLSLRKGRANYYDVNLYVECPELWTPDSPILHQLEIKLVDGNGILIDGMLQKVGIRKIEYRGRDGLYLNNKPYRDKLIGVNRHQDFAIIGNALPNSLHWRDAKKLRDAGIRVVRCIHYPHDPAFLDACDEFGILTILAVAGWQFWNDEPVFSERAYSDIRGLVRRDRNHPSTFMWEPVLNETHFPKEYAHNAKKTVDEEYPYEQALSACDPGSPGSDYFPVIYTHPTSVSAGKKSVYNAGTLKEEIMYFTREFGDNVDDWNSHSFMPKKDMEALVQKYQHPILKKYGEMAKEVGGHGGMDFIMDSRLVYCLQNGLPLDMDVYDLAEWCCLAELGELSMDNNCAAVAFPDFTRGEWNKVKGYKHAYASPEDESVAMEKAKKITAKLKEKGAVEWAGEAVENKK